MSIGYFWKAVSVRFLWHDNGHETTMTFAPVGVERESPNGRYAFEELEARIENKINDWIDGDYVLKADDLATTVSAEIKAWIEAGAR